MLKIGVVGPTFPPIDGITRITRSIEDKGYDSLWFPDHLMGWFPHTMWTTELMGPLSLNSPHTFFETTLSIAVAAEASSRIRVGSAVTEAIRHHPAMLAQSYATLEHLTRSRVILGIGAGELENVRPYGLPYERVVSRLEEALQVIRLLWNAERDELLTYEGHHFQLHDAVFALPPFRSRPPIWIGGVGERMCKLTARYADGWLPTTIKVDDYRQRLRIIRDECQHIGRSFDAIERAMYVHLIIDNDRDECLRIMEAPIIKAGALLAPASLYDEIGYTHPLGATFYPLTDYIPAHYPKEVIMQAIDKVPQEVVRASFAWGTVDDVIEQLDQYRKAGVQTVVFWNFTFLGDITKVKSSYACIDQLVEYFNK